MINYEMPAYSLLLVPLIAIHVEQEIRRNLT